jgi:hypothetical protein
MSIINDALKKTQDDLLGKQPVPAAPANPEPVLAAESGNPMAPPEKPILKKSPAAGSALSAKQKKERFIIIVAAAAGILVLAVMIIVFSRITRSGLPTKRATLRANAFVINGVMVQNNKTVALINNEIFEVGETVNGKKIVNITVDRIDVLEKGEIKSFPVSKKKQK